jgi:hypothetical protein
MKYLKLHQHTYCYQVVMEELIFFHLWCIKYIILEKYV